MKELMILTLIYAIGIVILVMTGILKMDWTFIVAVIIGIAGVGYSAYKNYIEK